MAPRVVGTAIAQLNFVVNNSLASRMGEGAVSAINYGWMLMLLPQGVFAQAVGTAAFPTFSAQAARNDLDDLRSSLASTLRAVFFLSLPATVGLMVLGRPLVALLFERGAFAASSTDAVTWAVVLFAIGLVGHAGLEIVARAFYALHDTLTPVWVGAVAVATNVAFSVLLSRAFVELGWPPHAGLALANSVATLTELGLLLGLMARRMGGLQLPKMFRSVVKAGIAAAVMAAALWGWQAASHGVSALVEGAGGVVVGGIVYLVAALLLGADEPRAVLGLVMARRRASARSNRTGGADSGSV
jgi:putative peptidoglycan lipid II flippase